MKLLLSYLIFCIFLIIILSFFNSNTKIFGLNIWHKPKKLINYKLDGNETSKQVFDIYIISHFNSGIFFYLILKLLKINEINIIYICVIGAIIFEIFENTNYIINNYRAEYKNYTGDSIVNIIGDIISFIFGIIVARFNIYFAILLFIITEIFFYQYKSSSIYLCIIAFLHFFK